MKKVIDYPVTSTSDINASRLLEELQTVDPAADVYLVDLTYRIVVDELTNELEVNAVVAAHDPTKKSQAELDSTVTKIARTNLAALDKGTLDPVIADILTVLGI